MLAQFTVPPVCVCRCLHAYTKPRFFNALISLLRHGEAKHREVQHSQPTCLSQYFQKMLQCHKETISATKKQSVQRPDPEDSDSQFEKSWQGLRRSGVLRTRPASSPASSPVSSLHVQLTVTTMSALPSMSGTSLAEPLFLFASWFPPALLSPSPRTTA